jgi:hypothetical protein
MHFGKTILVSLLGLGAVTLAAPVEGVSTVAATVETSTWDQ